MMDSTHRAPEFSDGLFRTIGRNEGGAEGIRASQRGPWLLEYLRQEIAKPWVQQLVAALASEGTKGVVCGFPWSGGSTLLFGDPQQELLVFTSKGEFRLAVAPSGALNDWKTKTFGSKLSEDNIDTVWQHVVGQVPMTNTPADIIMNSLVREARERAIPVTP